MVRSNQLFVGTCNHERVKECSPECDRLQRTIYLCITRTFTVRWFGVRLLRRIMTARIQLGHVEVWKIASMTRQCLYISTAECMVNKSGWRLNWEDEKKYMRNAHTADDGTHFSHADGAIKRIFRDGTTITAVTVLWISFAFSGRLNESMCLKRALMFHSAQFFFYYLSYNSCVLSMASSAQSQRSEYWSMGKLRVLNRTGG